jgi:hypothetical protein
VKLLAGKRRLAFEDWAPSDGRLAPQPPVRTDRVAADPELRFLPSAGLKLDRIATIFANLTTARHTSDWTHDALGFRAVRSDGFRP